MLAVEFTYLMCVGFRFGFHGFVKGHTFSFVSLFNSFHTLHESALDFSRRVKIKQLTRGTTGRSRLISETGLSCRGSNNSS